MPKRAKVIQIGAEHDHATAAMDTLLAMPDLFEVAGYVIPEDEPTEQYRASMEHYKNVPKLTLEEAFAVEGLTGCVIETSEKNLTRYAALAAEHGFAVHMDKPGGDIPAEYMRLLDLVEEKGLVFTTGYMYRYNPAIEEAIRKAKSGELGEILYVEAQMNCLHTIEKRFWLQRYQGGMMFFLGCHLVDLIYRIMGEPQEVLPMNCVTGADSATGEDHGFALFRYPHGWSFARTTAVETGGFMRRQLVIAGTKGTLELKPLEYYSGSEFRNMSTDMYTATDPSWHPWPVKETFGPINRYEIMLRTFGEAALGLREAPFSVEYERNVYRLAMRASGIPV